MATDYTLRMRPMTASLNTLAAYGGTTPEPLRVAREQIRAAHLVSVGARVADPLSLAREVIASSDMETTLKAVAKRRAAARDAAEVAASLVEAASENALRVFHDHADEIADEILASPLLASAFAEVERLAFTVPPSALARPNVDDLDTVAAVATLLRAVRPFESVFVSLVSSSLVSAYELPGVAGLLYADPRGADPEAVRRGLKGLRPGVPDLSVWTVSTTHAAHAAPVGASGVSPALLASTPGVTFSHAVTLDEFEARVRYAERTAPAVTLDEDADEWAGAVL